MGFSIRKAEGDVMVMDLDGELDRHAGLKDLRQCFATMRPEAGTLLLFNFKTVTYVCSEAAGLVCSMAEEVRRGGGKAACCALNGLPKDVFELLGVTKILAAYETEDTALTELTAAK